MTLLDDVKFLATANSFKAGVLYSIKPDDGSCDLPITRSTTATRVDPSGIIETVAVNAPQIDYSDGCGCFLIEPVVTNLHLYSEEIDNAAYSKSDVTVTANAITSPDGTTNADECETTGTGAQMYQTISLAASKTYTWSFYVKRGTMTDIGQQIFNMDGDGEYGTGGKYYSQTTASGWTRVSFTFTTGSNGGNTRFYPINSSGVTGTIYLWGFQLEQHTADNIMQSSYIKTTSGTVTRNPTSFIKTDVSGTIGSAEGTLFGEIAFPHNGTSTTSEQNLLGIHNSNDSSLVHIGKWGTSAIGFIRKDGGSNVLFSFDQAISSGAYIKQAIRYKAGDHSYWKDGSEIATSTDSTAINATQNRIVSSFTGISSFWEFYGKIRTLQVYNTALTDAQLTSLTS